MESANAPTHCGPILSVFQVDFWRPPSDPGKAVDMRVSPDDFVKLTESLNRYKIRHKVQIFDLQAIINRQDDVSETSSWYNKYHTLDEVYIIRYFSVIILIIEMLSLIKFERS